MSERALRSKPSREEEASLESSGDMISERTQTLGKRGTDEVKSFPSGNPVDQGASLKLLSLS